VLGIIALAIVGGMASSGVISAGAVGGIAAKAFGFWIGLTILAFLLARPFERIMRKIRYAGASAGIGLHLFV
jgi:Kef-type K+ transport system membrane component KefB